MPPQRLLQARQLCMLAWPLGAHATATLLAELQFPVLGSIVAPAAAAAGVPGEERGAIGHHHHHALHAHPSGAACALQASRREMGRRGTCGAWLECMRIVAGSGQNGGLRAGGQQTVCDPWCNGTTVHQTASTLRLGLDSQLALCSPTADCLLPLSAPAQIADPLYGEWLDVYLTLLQPLVPPVTGLLGEHEQPPLEACGSARKASGWLGQKLETGWPGGLQLALNRCHHDHELATCPPACVALPAGEYAAAAVAAAATAAAHCLVLAAGPDCLQAPPTGLRPQRPPSRLPHRRGSKTRPPQPSYLSSRCDLRTSSSHTKHRN